jgi:hypothetical protein
MVKLDKMIILINLSNLVILDMFVDLGRRFRCSPERFKPQSAINGTLDQGRFPPGLPPCKSLSTN